MRKIINSKTFLIIILILIFAGWYSQNKKGREYNDYKCETKKYAIKGVIDKINPKSGYMQAHINNLENWISLSISEIIQSQGFPAHYDYEVGDSIIKEANSKKFKIKRDEKFAIYLLDCNE
jgi:hypothetical protein